MSSFQQINELRRAGRLEEAYGLARQALAENSSIWNKRAMSWVLYGLLKKAQADRETKAAIGYLGEIAQLELPPEESMFWERLPGLLGRLVYALPEADVRVPAHLEALFGLLRELPVRKPGEGYSFLLRAYQVKGKHWALYPDFIDWWGFDSFIPPDYEMPVLPNGKRGLALVEQVLTTYAKHLLGEYGDGRSPATDTGRMEAFLPVLQRSRTERPEFQYVAYYHARLLLALDRREEALRAFLPFARQKQGEYWVWDTMADLFPSEPSLQFACLCKALCCRLEDKFSVKLRRRLIPLLLEREETAQAAAQVRLLKDIYTREGWKTPIELSLWSLASRAKEGTPEAVDTAFFQAHAREAEMLLCRDIPEEVILIGSVHREKRVAYYVSAAEQQGSFYCQAEGPLPDIGTAFRARLSSEKGRTRALFLQRIPEDEVPENLRKRFSGTLRRAPGQAFAFVDDVYFPPALVEAYALTHGQALGGSAVRTWDKQKGRLGWRADGVDGFPPV